MRFIFVLALAATAFAREAERDSRDIHDLLEKGIQSEETTKKVLKELASKAAQDEHPSMVERLKEGLHDMLTPATPVPEDPSLGQRLSQLKDTVSEKLSSLSPSTPAPEEPGVVQRMKDGFAEIKESVSERIGSLSHATPVPEPNVVQRLKTGLSEMKETVSEKIGSFSHATPEPNVLQRIKTGLSDLKDTVTDSIGSQASGARESVKTSVDGKVEHVKAALHDQKDKVKAAIGEQSDRVKGAADRVKGKVDESMATASSYAYSAASQLRQHAEDFEKNLAKLRASLPSSSGELADRVTKAYNNAETQVKSSVSSVITALTDATPSTEAARAAYEDASQRSLEAMMTVRRELAALEKDGLPKVDLQGIISAISSGGTELAAATTAAGHRAGGLLSNLKDRLM